MFSHRSLNLCPQDLNLFQGTNKFGRINLLLELGRVVVLAADKVPVPGKPVRPLRPVLVHLVRVRDVSNFAECNWLCRVAN